MADEGTIFDPNQVGKSNVAQAIERAKTNNANRIAAFNNTVKAYLESETITVNRGLPARVFAFYGLYPGDSFVKDNLPLNEVVDETTGASHGESVPGLAIPVVTAAPAAVSAVLGSGNLTPTVNQLISRVIEQNDTIIALCKQIISGLGVINGKLTK